MPIFSSAWVELFEPADQVERLAVDLHEIARGTAPSPRTPSSRGLRSAPSPVFTLLDDTASRKQSVLLSPSVTLLLARMRRRARRLDLARNELQPRLALVARHCGRGSSLAMAASSKASMPIPRDSQALSSCLRANGSPRARR